MKWRVTWRRFSCWSPAVCPSMLSQIYTRWAPRCAPQCFPRYIQGEPCGVPLNAFPDISWWAPQWTPPTPSQIYTWLGCSVPPTPSQIYTRWVLRCAPQSLSRYIQGEPRGEPLNAFPDIYMARPAVCPQRLPRYIQGESCGVPLKAFLDTVKAFYFVGQKFRRLKTTDIFVGTWLRGLPYPQN